MRNIGILFILVIFGMSIWKASDRYRAEASQPAAPISSPQAHVSAPTIVRETPPPETGAGEQESQQPQEPEQVEPASMPLVENLNKSGPKPLKKISKPEQPEKSFERLVIPTLKVNAAVETKPYSELSWDLTALGQDVAQLGNIPNQVSDNNIVLAGHVTVWDGSNGPFRYLWRLNPGDRMLLEDDEFTYTYIVREQVLVYPDDSSVLADSDTPQLTLITCTTWDEETLSYLRRRVIFADLEKVEARQVLME
jgi:LPXTG-site transpeptidase (sortase) family protein